MIIILTRGDRAHTRLARRGRRGRPLRSISIIISSSIISISSSMRIITIIISSSISIIITIINSSSIVIINIIIIIINRPLRPRAPAPRGRVLGGAKQTKLINNIHQIYIYIYIYIHTYVYMH